MSKIRLKLTPKSTKLTFFREIVSLREENRQMRAKLAERERAKEAENKDVPLFSQKKFAKIGGRLYSEKYFLPLFRNRGRAYFEIGDSSRKLYYWRLVFSLGQQLVPRGSQ